jgi:hypothetical protein
MLESTDNETSVFSELYTLESWSTWNNRTIFHNRISFVSHFPDNTTVYRVKLPDCDIWVTSQGISSWWVWFQTSNNECTIWSFSNPVCPCDLTLFSDLSEPIVLGAFSFAFTSHFSVLSWTSTTWRNAIRVGLHDPAICAGWWPVGQLNTRSDSDDRSIKYFTSLSWVNICSNDLFITIEWLVWEDAWCWTTSSICMGDCCFGIWAV